jgi:hypothetical protein
MPNYATAVIAVSRPKYISAFRGAIAIDLMPISCSQLVRGAWEQVNTVIVHVNDFRQQASLVRCHRARRGGFCQYRLRDRFGKSTRVRDCSFILPIKTKLYSGPHSFAHCSRWPCSSMTSQWIFDIVSRGDRPGLTRADGLNAPPNKMNLQTRLA